MKNPDYRNMVDAAWNRVLAQASAGAKARIPLYEHLISPFIMEKIIGKRFAALYDGDFADKTEFFRRYCEFFTVTGYDTVSFECCVGAIMPGSGALGGHKEGAIKTRADFDAYPWAEIPDRYFAAYSGYFRALAGVMPVGMKAVGGVGNGIFECVQDITGFQNLCYIRADDEELYAGLFQKTGDALTAIWERFLNEFGDLFCVCRFGDDLGYKSSTLLSADDIKARIVPQYRRVVDLVHGRGKPFLLHSCGCIFDVMDDMIERAGINAKHSNEDVISPYSRWIDEYGDKIANFGGVDTDVLCDSSSVDLVPYVTAVYRLAEKKGRGVAIGSGNSIPDYVSVSRYSLMLETVRKLRGDYDE